MNRRAFLSSLALASAGMALDPERLLWVPGAKRIFLPPRQPRLGSFVVQQDGRWVELSQEMIRAARFGGSSPFGVVTGYRSWGPVVLTHGAAVVRIGTAE